jgi:hypothetical protein
MAMSIIMNMKQARSDHLRLSLNLWTLDQKKISLTATDQFPLVAPMGLAEESGGTQSSSGHVKM